MLAIDVRLGASGFDVRIGGWFGSGEKSERRKRWGGWRGGEEKRREKEGKRGKWIVKCEEQMKKTEWQNERKGSEKNV